MIDEAGIVDMASKEASWEEVLEYVISEEGMDPWDVDVVKLADAFKDYVETMGDLASADASNSNIPRSRSLDFKVPARLIMIAAVLLHMKTEVLMFSEEAEEEKEEKEDAGPPINIDRVPDLEVPAKRVPKRRVTLDELVHALDKAFGTKERRERKEVRARERVEEVVADDDFDIDEKIEELNSRITKAVDQLRSGTMPFSELVPVWEREEIVQSLLGVLHISNDGVVDLEQEEPFEEIYVTVREGRREAA